MFKRTPEPTPDVKLDAIPVNVIGTNELTVNVILEAGATPTFTELMVINSVTMQFVPAVAIATGLSHGIILNTSGSIEGWGSNNYGEGTVSPALPSIIAIACGNSHSLVLTNTLQLLAWGLNTDLQTTIPVGLSISPVPTTNSLNSMIVGNTKAKKTTTSAVPEDTVDVKLLVIVIVSILVILIILIVSVYFIHYAFTKK